MNGSSGMLELPKEIWHVVLNYLDETTDIRNIIEVKPQCRSFINDKIQFSFHCNMLSFFFLCYLNDDCNIDLDDLAEHYIAFEEISHKYESDTNYLNITLEICGYRNAYKMIIEYSELADEFSVSTYHYIDEMNFRQIHRHGMYCDNRCRSEHDKYIKTIGKRSKKYKTMNKMFRDFGANYFVLSEDPRITQMFRFYFKKYFNMYYTKIDRII